MKMIQHKILNVRRKFRLDCACTVYTLLKSNVTTWSVGGRCRGSQECGSRNVNFACKFH